MAIWKRLLICGLGAALAALASRGAPSAAVPAHYYFKHLILAPSEAKAIAMGVKPGAPSVLVDELPSLSNKEFGDVVGPYIGREITDKSLVQLVNDITAFLHGHGQQLVNVSIPPQNVVAGDLRLVVVLGAYNLQRLVLGSDFDHTRDLKIEPGSGQIVLNDLPLLQQQAFAVALAPAFGKPITDEALDTLIDSIGRFVKSQGQILAKVALPPQDIRTGELRLALSLGNFPLKRIYLGDSAAAAAKLPAPAPSDRIVAPGLPIFNTPEFAHLVAKYFDRPIDKEMESQLRGDIAAYVQRQDRVAASIPPAQIDLPAGDLRIVVALEHYSQVRFKGNRWFSERLLARQLGVKPGDEVRVSQLEAAVNQLNQNPFRHAEVLIDTVNKDPGVADLDVGVTEVAPYRASFSYDDTGNDTLGNNHYTLTGQAANLWGADHQLSLQFTTTDVSHAYQSEVLTYRAPLPWHHYLQLTGAFTDYRTDILDNNFHIKGRAYQGDLRYVIPVIRANWSLEYSAGVDYKQNYFDQSFAGVNVNVVHNAQDVAQATSSVTWLEHDKSGSSAVSVNGNFSPGNFNNRNTNATFQGNLTLDPTTGEPVGGPEAQARYIYETGFVQRLTTLPGDFQWLERAQGQESTARLVSSERFSIGGSATVRGYNERISSGDEGWAITSEIRSPIWRQHLPFTPAQYAPLETRFLAFFDDGRAGYRHERVDDVPLVALCSAGVGLRSNWASNFSVSADYGWQLLENPPGLIRQPNRSRWHLQGALSY